MPQGEVELEIAFVHNVQTPDLAASIEASGHCPYGICPGTGRIEIIPMKEILSTGWSTLRKRQPSKSYWRIRGDIRNHCSDQPSTFPNINRGLVKGECSS